VLQQGKSACDQLVHPTNLHERDHHNDHPFRSVEIVCPAKVKGEYRESREDVEQVVPVQPCRQTGQTVARALTVPSKKVEVFPKLPSESVQDVAQRADISIANESAINITYKTDDAVAVTKPVALKSALTSG